MPAGEVRRGDDPLIAAAQAGDRGAFDELVRRHQHEVFTLALRLTADREMAFDVSQEAFVRAWRAMPNFRGDAQFSTWMHRITVNTAWTLRRRARRHHAQSLTELAHEPESSGLSPEAAGEAAALRPRLIEALDKLPMSNRAVVILRDVHGWSHNEISEHLDISVTAAKVRLHRGRRRLRELLFDATDMGGAA